MWFVLQIPLLPVFLLAVNCYSKSSEVLPVVRKSKRTSEKGEINTDKYGTDFNYLDSVKAAFNTWHRHETWACNEPQVKSYGVATFSTLDDGQLRNQVLLFGGYMTSGTDSWSVHDTTWIYCEQLHSWRRLDDLAEHPPQRYSPIMVTLCNGNVLLIGGFQPNVHATFVSKDIWLFLGTIFEWKQVSVVGDIGLPIQFRIEGHARAVSVIDTNSSCSCQEAILIFPCQSSVNWTVLFELSCLEESKSYRWTQRVTHSVTQVCMPIVTSQSKETVITVVGGCLWYLSVNNLTWTPTAICRRWDSRFPLSEELIAVYGEESMTYVLFSVRLRQIILFSLSTLTTSTHPVVGNVPWPKENLRLKDAVPNVIALGLSDSEILVFIQGLKDLCVCGLREWILRNTAGTGGQHYTWVWTERLSRQRSPPVYSLYDINYAVWRNKLYILGNGDDDNPSSVVPGRDSDHLWSLNLLSMTWELIEKANDRTEGYITKEAAILGSETIYG